LSVSNNLTALPEADQAGPASSTAVNASAMERREIIETSLAEKPRGARQSRQE
jgi:hypothetical protein